MTLLSEKAQKIVPYTAGEQPRDKAYVKLNTNENPYAPSPAAVKALTSFDADSLRLYPDPQSLALREAIAAVENVKAANVFCGNGSDEVLALSFAALLSGRKNVAFPDISYSFYPVFSQMFEVVYKTVPVDADYRVNSEDYIKAGLDGVVLANPNAPTTRSLTLSEIEAIVSANQEVPVIIDEAYIDFAERAQSAVPLTKKYGNLLVVKTFSKSYALAGIRCGYAVGSPALLDGLCRMRDSFNSYPVDRVCAAVCAASIADRDYFEQKRALVSATRNDAREKLCELGYCSPKSDANFLFVTVPDGDGEAAYRYLKSQGVLVRYFAGPRLTDKLRITVGTPEEMAALIAAIKTYKR